MTNQESGRKRSWEKAHPARRYLIPTDLRDAVAALAESLMENVDPVACVLFDYAVICHRRGTLALKPRPNPRGRKHTLLWEEGEARPIAPLERRQAKEKSTADSRSLKGQTAAYRLGEKRHRELKEIAASTNLPLADVLTVFFRHSLRAYQQGQLRIRREPAIIQMQVKGWLE